MLRDVALICFPPSTAKRKRGDHKDFSLEAAETRPSLSPSLGLQTSSSSLSFPHPIIPTNPPKPTQKGWEAVVSAGRKAAPEHRELFLVGFEVPHDTIFTKCQSWSHTLPTSCTEVKINLNKRVEEAPLEMGIQKAMKIQLG